MIDLLFTVIGITLVLLILAEVGNSFRTAPSAAALKTRRPEHSLGATAPAKKERNHAGSAVRPSVSWIFCRRSRLHTRLR